MHKSSNLFTTAFISYSRRNLAFASKLHKHLINDNWNIWFDQEDIPPGVDFQEEIEEGIRCTDNFLFIISPESIASKYCRMEIEIAVRYHKRIIPLLHKDLVSDKDWSSLHPSIGKINWLYFVEDQDFDKSYQSLIGIFENHKDYVHQHTLLLSQAIEWQRSGRSDRKILTRNHRISAQQWLKTTFAGQPPCIPTALHCEFISYSQKTVQNGYCDVFMGQLPTFNELREKLRISLLREGLTVWSHEFDIKPGSMYRGSVEQGIELSDNILFFITADSITDESCLWEIDYARSLEKRIIPILLQEIENQSLPPFLQTLQEVSLLSFFNFPGNFLNHTPEFTGLLNIIETDKEYLHTHKIILNQALKWKTNRAISSLLLTGRTLELAKTWLVTAKNRSLHHATDLHMEFIENSATKTIGLQPEVYISYSRNDSEYARLLNEQLQLAGRITWFDQENLSDEDLLKENIDASLNLLFILSNQSYDSYFGLNEIEYAIANHKRVLVLQIEEIAEPFSKQFQNVKIISVVGLNPTDAAQRLLIELNSNKEYLTAFARWQKKAVEWKDADRNQDLLLRALEFQQANSWYLEALENDIQPKPTDIITLFLDESQLKLMAEKEEESQRQQEFMRLEMQKARSEKRFQRLVIIGVSTALVVIGFFAALSYRAYHNSKGTFTNRYENLLSVIANVKANQLSDIFVQMGNSLELLRTTPTLVDLVKELERENATRFVFLRNELNRSLKPIQRAYNYNDVLIVNRNGKVLYKSNETDTKIPLNSFLVEFKDAIDKFKQTNNNTFYITLGTQLFLLTPVIDESKVVGVFVAVFDLEKNIYPLLNVENTLGQTGEIILSSYFDNGATLKIISPFKYNQAPVPLQLLTYRTENAAHVLTSKPDCVPFTRMMEDYRGEEVLLSGLHIPIVGWGIVVKIDKKAMLKDFKFF